MKNIKKRMVAIALGYKCYTADDAKVRLVCCYTSIQVKESYCVALFCGLVTVERDCPASQ